MCLLIWDIRDDNFLSSRKKSKNYTFHSKLFDLFNNKFKIMFLCGKTDHFDESYSDPDDTYSWLFDRKNGT